MKIFCEGEKTEPNYINGYLEYIGSSSRRSVVQVEKTRKNTPVQLVEAAIEAKSSKSTLPDDEFWVVYDREGVAKYSDALHEKARQAAEKSGVSVALSNVCFEYWILLHLVDTQAPFSCYDDLKKVSSLNEEIRKRTGGSYEKNSATIFSVVKDSVDTARKRAARLNAAGKENANRGRDEEHHINPFMGVVKLLDAIDAFE
jgi:hypothetical protein